MFIKPYLDNTIPGQRCLLSLGSLAIRNISTFNRSWLRLTCLILYDNFQKGIDWIYRTADQRNMCPIEMAALLLKRVSGHAKNKAVNQLATKLYENREVGATLVPVNYACWLICFGQGLGKSYYR